MKEMLAGVSLINSFYESPLYRHMEFKKSRAKKFSKNCAKNLLKMFSDEETYGFLKSRLGGNLMRKKRGLFGAFCGFGAVSNR